MPSGVLEREGRAPAHPVGTPVRPLFFRRRRLLALVPWLVLIGAYQLHAWRSGLTPAEAMRLPLDFAASAGLVGALFFLVAWVARPLLLFPAAVLATAGGFAFGPVSGVALTLVGGNASASVGYLLGRFFGGGALETGRARRYAGKIRDNDFEAILTAQLAYLPFDLVNGLAGCLRVRWRRFALATLVGTLPGAVSFVLLGAALEMDPAAGNFSLDPRLLPVSAAVFLAGIFTCRYLKRRAKTNDNKGATS